MKPKDTDLQSLVGEINSKLSSNSSTLRLDANTITIKQQTRWEFLWRTKDSIATAAGALTKKQASLFLLGIKQGLLTNINLQQL